MEKNDQRFLLPQERRKKLTELARQAIDQATPILQAHKTELEQRSIRVDLTSNGDYLRFAIYYADGAHEGFELRLDKEYGDYQFAGLFTDGGRSYRALGGGPPVDERWELEMFKQYVERCIRSFMGSADRHGGVRWP